MKYNWNIIQDIYSDNNTIMYVLHGVLPYTILSKLLLRDPNYQLLNGSFSQGEMQCWFKRGILKVQGWDYMITLTVPYVSLF